MDPKDIFQELVYSFWEVVKSVEIGYLTPDADGRISRLVTKADPAGLNITQQLHRAFGACYTIDFQQWVKQLGVYYVTII